MFHGLSGCSDAWFEGCSFACFDESRRIIQRTNSQAARGKRYPIISYRSSLKARAGAVRCDAKLRQLLESRAHLLPLKRSIRERNSSIIAAMRSQNVVAN